MKRKSFVWIIIVLLLACGCGYFIWDNLESKKIEVSYADFYTSVENGDVKTAKINDDKIIFDGKQTVNPHSPMLEEFLLKNGVEVEVYARAICILRFGQYAERFRTNGADGSTILRRI